MVPLFTGTLPPVPQFSIASPEIGHLAPASNSLNQRIGNRTSGAAALIDMTAIGQKPTRMNKLQPLNTSSVVN